MKSLLVISLSDLANDPRVNRQIRLFAPKYRVLAAGLSSPRLDGVEFFPIPQIPRPFHWKVLGAMHLKLGLYERYYWADRRVQACLTTLANVRADLVLANDLIVLPVALALANGAKVVFDAHEYFPREQEDNFRWRFFFQRYNDFMCRQYLPRADDMLTVCQSIAEAYRENYGVDPKVVTNAPPYHDLQPGDTDAGAIRLIHHGVATHARRIELMIEMMEHLDERFQLDLMLVPSPAEPAYYERLRALAARHQRVRLVPPVPMRELPRHLNTYDVGVYLLPPNNFNNQFALPNKFFEFVQARLALAIGPSPEMARLARQYDCGIVSEDFTPASLACKLNGLDRQEIDRLKQRSHEAAKDLCFEKNAQVLLETVARQLGDA